MRFLPVLAAACLLTAAFLIPSAAAQSSAGCQFRSGGGPAAFCDTFDTVHPNTGARSGDLDGSVWGVSHADTNLYKWEEPFHLNRCGSDVMVNLPHDVQVCNGTLVEGLADSGVNTLAMYPRQPFDIAGRTGTVTFDVSDDTQGAHTAWPSFVFSDQPVPAASTGSGVADYARDAVGMSFAFVGQEPDGSFCINVDHIWTDTNYIHQDQPINRPQSGECGAHISPANSLQLNHVEVKLNSGGVQVYIGDPGHPETTKLAAQSSFAVPLTRGLVWMQDTHYAACKEPGTQCDHTFAWDNFGFDGPTLPRDAGYEYPDNVQATGQSGGCFQDYYTDSCEVYIGYYIENPSQSGRQSQTLTFHNVVDPSKASAALYEFNYFPLIDQSKDRPSFDVLVNGSGHVHQDWLFPTPPPGSMTTGYASQTMAIPIPLSMLHAGDNSFEVTSTNGMDGANYDLIMVGAGSGGGGIVGVPQPTATPVPATSTPVPTGTPAPLSSPTPTPVPATVTPTSGPSMADQFAITMHKGAMLDLTCSGGTLAQGQSTGSSDVVVECQ